MNYSLQGQSAVWEFPLEEPDEVALLVVSDATIRHRLPKHHDAFAKQLLPSEKSPTSLDVVEAMKFAHVMITIVNPRGGTRVVQPVTMNLADMACHNRLTNPNLHDFTNPDLHPEKAQWGGELGLMHDLALPEVLNFMLHMSDILLPRRFDDIASWDKPKSQDRLKAAGERRKFNNRDARRARSTQPCKHPPRFRIKRNETFGLGFVVCLSRSPTQRCQEHQEILMVEKLWAAGIYHSPYTITISDLGCPSKYSPEAKSNTYVGPKFSIDVAALSMRREGFSAEARELVSGTPSRLHSTARDDIYSIEDTGRMPARSLGSRRLYPCRQTMCHSPK